MAGGRSVWTGTIALGAAQLPVRAFIAASARDVSLNLLHQHDDGSVSKVKQQFICEADAQVVERSSAARGYEHERDKFVVLTDEDLATVRVASRSTMEITSFARAEEVDAVYLEQAYSLAAEDSGRRTYALLLRLLTDHQLVAVGKIAMRDKEQLCVLRPMGGELLLWTLYYADEVRVDPAVPMVDVGISEAEMAMGKALVDLLRKPFDLHEHQDEYRAGLGALVQTKLAGGTVELAAPTPAADAPVTLSLADALRVTLERTKPTKPAAKKAAKAPGSAARGRRASA